MYDLRDYQIEPTEIGVNYFKEGNSKPSIIVAPTAFGKSIVIGHIANSLTEKAIVLQPSIELLKQNYSKLIALGGQASVYSASAKSKEYGHITYATIGSIKNLGEEFKSRGYKYLIVDEAHLYPRNSDSMFGTFMGKSGIKSVLGFTATPFKLQTNLNPFSGETYSRLVMLTSRNKHGTFYKKILHVTQIKEIVDKKFWAKLLYEIYDFDTGKLVYNSTKAEFTEDSIQKAYEEQDIETKVVLKIADIDRKSIIVFAPSVNTAIALSKRIKNSAVVYSGMDDKEREKIITNFKAGIIRVVVNVNILSVGFDDPTVDCIIMARPTASLAWFYQAAGRGTRIHPDKEDCLIVDLVGNSDRFGRLEDLYFKYQAETWKLYGTGGKLLTGIGLHEIGEHIDPDLVPVEDIRMPVGKHIGKKLSEVPQAYLEWMLRDFTFTPKTYQIRDAILKMKKSKV